MIKNDYLVTSISKNKITKIRRNGYKERILKIVKKHQYLDGAKLTNLCSKEMGISKTVVKGLIKELVCEKSLDHIETFNNEKHYFIQVEQFLDESIMLDPHLVRTLTPIDETLEWMEKSYRGLTLESKGVTVKHILVIIFKMINRLVISQSRSNPDCFTHKRAWIEYQRRIQRLYKIIDDKNDSDREIIISWTRRILGTFPHDFKEFMEPA
ncbi:MAG: hypothetical protein ACRDFB_02400 [Rhabdochlamydiaceae bacterium]